MQQTESLQNEEQSILAQRAAEQFSHPQKKPVYPMTVRGLARMKRELRAEYRSVSALEEKSEAARWLCDNYYLLCREGEACRQALCRKKSLPAAQLLTRLYSATKSMFEAGALPSRENVSALLEGCQQVQALTVPEFEALPLVLRFCALEAALPSKNTLGDISFGVRALWEIADLNFNALLEEYSLTEQALRQDPDGAYPQSEDATRSFYRYSVSRLAKENGMSEGEICFRLLEAAEEGDRPERRHVGYWLFRDTPPGIRPLSFLGQNRRRAALYRPLLFLLPAVVCFVLGIVFRSASPLLLYFPLWEIFKPLIEFFLTRGLMPLPLFRQKTDADHCPKTLIVLSDLLPPARELDRISLRLRSLLSSNAGENIRICLLVDPKEAELPEMPEDRPRITALSALIRRLNAQYGDRFYLAVRRREYSETQTRFSGRERKRGAIEDLVRLMEGEDVSFLTVVGDRQFLSEVEYLAALDADTIPSFDAIPTLIGGAIHPLNRPVIDPERGVVTQGYGILVPQTEVKLSAARRSVFSQLMAGNGGTAPYDSGCGELYQNLFGESIFAGKGLIHRKTFSALLFSRFPEGRVLSHDILEGGYLRTGFVSGAFCSEGFPLSPKSWLLRLHRWIRGDWQNIPWLGSFVPTPKGREKNPLSSLSRFQLMDNLRRSITPLSVVICGGVAAFCPVSEAGLLAGTALLSVIFPSLFSAFCALFTLGPGALLRRTFSGSMMPAAEGICRAVTELLMLGARATLSLDAISRAIWRMLRKKKLLEWTTAADSEKGGNPLRFFLFPAILGIFLFFLSPFLFLRGFSLLFWAAIPFAAFSGRVRPPLHTPPSSLEKERLTSYAAAIWGYFDDTVTEADSFLPPDNLQEAPAFALARRTSPTNIGFYLLTLLGAADLGFLTAEELCNRVSSTLSTLERMEKYKGNLYNWYSTKTLRVLPPYYVSSVDSGNLVGCLIALKEGLFDYRGEDDRIPQLMERVKALAGQTDLSIFYDEEKALFSIGINGKTGERSRSHYDFLMSEARLLSYVAVATRAVEGKHWAALSRSSGRCGSFSGPISWSGSIFEYLMPHLLLPAPEGSLLYEGVRFAILCQKRTCRKKGVPFGISESGYYAFDRELNYQYKAHGVPLLGIKQGLENDTVISPYSSFLILPFAPKKGMAALQELTRSGMMGRYGFYEALDMTQERLSGHRSTVIRSYMAHHLGMSFLSICNTLQDDIFVRRFMRDRQMLSAATLLEEKIPLATPFFRDKQELTREIRPRRKGYEGEEFDLIFPQAPRVHLLSGGELSEILTDTGGGYITYRGLNVTYRSTDLLENGVGVLGLIFSGDKVLPLTRLPFYEALPDYRVEFGEDHVGYFASEGTLSAGMRVGVYEGYPASAREFLIRNHSSRRVSAQLFVYLEPTLSSDAATRAHPAFNRLFLEAEYEKSCHAAVIRRRTREGERSVVLAVGFLEPIPMEYEAFRGNLLRRPEGVASLRSAGGVPFQKGSGVTDCCLAIRTPIDLPPRGEWGTTLLLAVGESKAEAVNRLIILRRQGNPFGRLTCRAATAGESMEARLAALLLPLILYGGRDTKEGLQAKSRNRLGVSGLWRLGISGDLPLVTVELSSHHELLRAAGYIRTHALLRKNGIIFDLAILYSEENEYGAPLLSALNEELSAAGSGEMAGERGGIHLVNTALCDEELLSLIRAFSCHLAPKQGGGRKMPVKPFRPAVIHPVKPLSFQGLCSKGRPRWTGESVPVPEGQAVGGCVFREGCVEIRETPNVPFCTVLANPTFGTLLSDRSPGFTFAVNSHECKLTPWSNDPYRDVGSERLLLRTDRIYDLTDGARAVWLSRRAEYGGTAGSITATTTVHVPSAGMVKEMVIRLKNTGDSPIACTLCYSILPVIGNDSRRRNQVCGKWKDGGLYLRNPFSHFPSILLMQADGGADSCCCDRAALLSGDWDAPSVCPQPDNCGAIFKKLTLSPGQEERVRFTLSFGGNEGAAEYLSRAKLPHRPLFEGKLRVETPDFFLNQLLNTWLPVQIKQCRISARTGFYQNGGAYGFRDQLQDAIGLLLIDPITAKRQIFRAAAKQFPEGDVLHWWHRIPSRENSGIYGVRTRYSDDLLWLPYAVLEYIRVTGDEAILDIRLPFVEGDPLSPEEHDRYFSPTVSKEKDSLYLHCIRAMTHANTRGPHGLCLIGSGDWNDGFSSVGTQMRGESVWLSQFAGMIFRDFSAISSARGDIDTATQFATASAELFDAVETHCFSNDRYLRAFYDNGAAMGSELEQECAIDALPQSFSVIAGMGNPQRRKIALDTALRELVDDENAIIRLFTPPFGKGIRKPGYVKAYPEGIRENGGQYTHGVVWLALALLMEGRANEGYRLLSILNPAKRLTFSAAAENYQREPYFMAGDIYTNPEVYGRGGWSLYTGAAGWYYRTATEHLLGIRRRGKLIRLSPCLPDEWPGYSANLSLKGAELQITVCRGEQKGMTVNGISMDAVPLLPGKYNVTVTI